VQYQILKERKNCIAAAGAQALNELCTAIGDLKRKNFIAAAGAQALNER
jgi:hypothetical protein